MLTSIQSVEAQIAMSPTVCLLCRRKLSQASTLSVGVAATGFTSTSAASQAVQGFTNAIYDGSLQSQMLSLASLSVSSVSYTQQPTITTSAAVVGAVPAPDIPSAKKSFPGCVWLHIGLSFRTADEVNQFVDTILAP